jgi:NRPS condensation-like uncharacterized protein
VSRREPRGTGPGRLPRSPFGLIDELNCYYDTPAEPNNIHLEVAMAGSLDYQALGQAVAGALAAAPRARGRMAAGRSFQRRYTWEFPSAPDVDPLSRATWLDEDELAAARARFLANAPPLRASPPVRLLLASGPDASCVILNAHHAAMDGMSSLELLRGIAARYRAIAGDPASPRPAPAQPTNNPPTNNPLASDATMSSPPTSHVPKDGATPSGASASSAPVGGGPADGASPNSAPPRAVPLNVTSPSQGAPSPGASIERAPLPGPPPPPSASPRTRGRAALPYPVARIAPERERRERPDGYGLRLLPVPGIPRAPGATVNDTLIAALIATISRWNAAHRQAPRATTSGKTGVKTGAMTRAIRITVPVNVRDPGLRGVTGNHSRIATVTADPRTAAGDLPALLAEVTRQTSALRQAPRRRASAGALGRAPGWCPVALKRLAVRLALRAIGRVVCDTCMLTNLGNVVDPPWSGYQGPVRMALSGPAHMPRGLSVAALTADGQLRLGFRYRYALFDDAAAARFTAAFAATLAELTSGAAPRRCEGGDTSGSARGAAQDSRLPGRQRLPHVLRRREPAVQPAPEARVPD